MTYNCQEITEKIRQISADAGRINLALAQKMGAAEALVAKQRIETILLELSHLPVTPEGARKIMGQDFLGLEAIEKVFGPEALPQEIPPIPFSKKELLKAKELGQFLVLRVDRAPSGEPLTIKKINELLGPKYAAEGSKLLRDKSWYENKDFFTKETPEVSWALTSKGVIDDSYFKDYLDQIPTIIRYLKQVFPEGLPEIYEYAAEDWQNNSKIDDIPLIDAAGWPAKIQEIIESLQINQLTRQTPAEAIYDLVMYHQNNGQHLLAFKLAWTSRQIPDSDCEIVSVGRFDTDGIDINTERFNGQGPYLSVCFSRKV